MTTTVDRPRPLARPPAAGAGLSAGLIAAAWAAAIGLVAVAVPVLLAWAGDGRSGSGAAAALRAVGRLWLVAQGTPLRLPTGTLALTPLGLALLPGALLWRAGRHTARRARVAGVLPAVRATACLTLPYAVLAAAAAVGSSAGEVRVSPARALLAAGSLAAAAGGAGVVREARLTGPLLRRLPPRVLQVQRWALAGLAVLLAAGAALAAGDVLAHVDRVAALGRHGGPGPLGGLLMLLLELGLAPNAVLWGSSWLTGPGFAVGTGTAVGPFGTSLGPVPDLPLLGALPGGGVPTWAGVLVLGLPLLTGALVGWLGARRRAGLLAAAGEALAAGVLAGLAVGALAWLAGGAVGGHHLARVGPSAWRVALAAAAELGLPAGAAAAARQYRRGDDAAVRPR